MRRADQLQDFRLGQIPRHQQCSPNWAGLHGGENWAGGNQQDAFRKAHHTGKMAFDIRMAQQFGVRGHVHVETSGNGNFHIVI